MTTIPFGLALDALTEAACFADNTFWKLIADRLKEMNNERSVLLAHEIRLFLEEANNDGLSDGEIEQ